MSSKLGKKKLRERPNDPARNIPEGVKREVRQRCGFGCVICGLPLYEYEHMEEWALVKRHVAEEITLLCSMHHDEKTKGLRSIDSVRLANANPISLRKNSSSPYFYPIQPDDIKIRIGTNHFYFDKDSTTNQMIVISIASLPIVWFNFEDGHLLLNLSIYDENNDLALSIRDNEMIYTAKSWDIEFVGTTLTIRSALRKITLVLDVSAEKKLISIDRALLTYDGYELIIDSDGIRTPHNGLANNMIQGSGQLINYGEPETSGINLEGYRTGVSIQK
jgi:hypothetical protein